MHNCIDPILFKTVLEMIRIADISPVKITPPDRLPVPIDEVVDGDGVVALKV
jgi:hypothetical protein